MTRIPETGPDRADTRPSEPKGRARPAIDEQLREADRLQSHRDDLDRRIRSLERWQPLRSFLDRSMTRAGGSIVTILAVLCLALVACNAIGLPAWVTVPALVALATSLARFAWVDLITAEERLAALYETYDRVHGEKTKLLLTCGWEQLRGVPFEEFLAKVFESLGYVVHTTKASGDHGVDLIACNGPNVLAIQAKGYPLSTVGNSAVQEAYSGMGFYRRQYGCNVCVVITNSTFTRAARVAAAELGCALIDRSTIPRLVRGELVL